MVPCFHLDGWIKYIRKDSEKKVAKELKTLYVEHERKKHIEEQDILMWEDLQDPPYPHNQQSYPDCESEADTPLSPSYVPSHNLFIKRITIDGTTA